MSVTLCYFVASWIESVMCVWECDSQFTMMLGILEDYLQAGFE